MQSINTTCPYCGVGCGLTVELKKGDLPLVRGQADHPANLGRLCSKGAALAETVNPDLAPPRLLAPSIDGQEVSWDSVTTEIAERIRECQANHGRDSVAFYLSGQLLTEDYYVANKLMKGFIGSANVDTNSRLCMSSAVAAYKRAFGSDTVPCDYTDLECAKIVVLVGSNMAWTHPVLYQRLVAAKEHNPDQKVVLIDPRRTITAELADLHLQIKPSADGFLFQGLLNYLIQHDSINEGYIATATTGFEQTKASCADLDMTIVANKTGLSEADLHTFYSWFGKHTQVVSFYSQGINQSATGTDKCNAIINCHLATGKLGYAGAGPFSITGQPNAMGGREVGGLANMLAAHMDFEEQDCERVKRFWNAPTIASEPGLKAVDLFDAIHAGNIKMVWIMGTNPAVSLPDVNRVREALEACETLIVSDLTETDTTAFANITLPALGWGEKDGTVTNSERRISRQRAFLPPPGEAKTDWWALAEVAKKMGFEQAFSYHSARDVFVEHASLSGYENNGSRDFNISGLRSLSIADYDQLQPVQWPLSSQASSGEQTRLFADRRFFTADGKARFIPIRAKAVNLPKHSESWLLMNTGRLRDQWHTMSRTGFSPSLNQHDTIPNLDMHPQDVAERGLVDGDFAYVSSQQGSAVLQVRVDPGIRPGSSFAPMHWSRQFATSSAVNALVPAVTDAVSGQPQSKAFPVQVKPLPDFCWSRVLSPLPLNMAEQSEHYWIQQHGPHLATTMSTNHKPDWEEWAREYSQDAVTTRFYNPIIGCEIIRVSQQDRLLALVSNTGNPRKLASISWMLHAAGNPDLHTVIRGEVGEPDATVCACFGTSRNTILALRRGGAASLAEIAGSTGCGSKCGSCLPEVASLLQLARI